MGDNEVKYAHVVSDREGMIMVVRLSGGSTPIIENPFMVFKSRAGVTQFEECHAPSPVWPIALAQKDGWTLT